MRDFLEVYLRKQFNKTKKKILIAHLDIDTSRFLKKSAMMALFFSVVLGIITFFMVFKFRTQASLMNNIFVSLVVLILGFCFAFWFMMHTIDVYILKRKKAMDQEVLFSGRYLLIKMQSGTPFFNSLIDASKVFGIAGKFFEEIIDEVDTGTPIEIALENAATTCPSKNFRIILREMNNALKLGVDVTKTLELILEDIASDQLEEIRAFGKKINALSMFYMIFAVVIPSLGMTIFIIASSFIGLSISLTHLFFVIFLLVFIQFMFLALFRSIRPTVNL